MNLESKTIYEYSVQLLESSKKEFEINTENMSERCIEVPWVAKNIRKLMPKKLLDIGISLASLDYLGMLLYIKNNYKICLEAIDIIQPQRVKTRYPKEWLDEIFSIPFLHGDIREFNFKNELFDMITCISVIEHIGYDEESEEGNVSAFKRTKNKENVCRLRDSHVNQNVLDKCAKLLKNNGKLLISVPMGKGGSVLLKDSLGYFTTQWEYERDSWAAIVGNKSFNVIEQKFYKMIDKRYWKEVESPENLVDCSSALSPHAYGCALCLLEKKS
ncbi:MAG: methyltransferase domain-containing protein [Acholeplasma sp.]|jgi:SAM-dependent methyltransferase|nr:methyltransferase domain-containing protein [Acholeplasma sp.]